MYLMMIVVTSFTNIFVSVILAWFNGLQLLFKIRLCKSLLYAVLDASGVGLEGSL